MDARTTAAVCKHIDVAKFESYNAKLEQENLNYRIHQTTVEDQRDAAIKENTRRGERIQGFEKREKRSFHEKGSDREKFDEQRKEIREQRQESKEQREELKEQCKELEAKDQKLEQQDREIAELKKQLAAISLASNVVQDHEITISALAQRHVSTISPLLHLNRLLETWYRFAQAFAVPTAD